MNPNPTKSLETFQTILKQEKESLFAKYKIKELGIFGTFTRFEATNESDLDIIINFLPDYCPSLLKFISINNYFSDTLGIKVDLVWNEL